ncbi:M6 family metalloprotease domain-containing protein [Nocardioides anomalus]|uniref:M6 family metalloprotease domain-containing protein n=1 Tax=Nocardioides anomalus TaxID=2712223 RepID=A0A6G6WB89_9ACTN|nr:M6 family metalloprotease domain-containing protein [Nocardioides anomalus]
MTRTNRAVVGIAGTATVVATLGLAATAAPSAQADPGPKATTDAPSASAPDKAQSHNRFDPMAALRSQQRQEAVDQLVAGDATLKGKGADRTIKTSEGASIDYPVNQTAQLLTFLVDFGDGATNPAYPTETEGPVAGDIPEPARSDNSTYWVPTFDREHYLDMFFKGLPSQGGESFKDIYKEMSDGRFDLEGDVSDWITVPNPEAYYQSATGDEDQASMTKYVGDTANAWYDAQKAAGKTDAEIVAYLKKFDVWDRYDFDGDGDYNEPDGYIDHFQAIHAGEGEEAGADPWAIWSHRWAAGQGLNVGPTVGGVPNKIGGVQIGTTGYFIRDYTTEPENGGLGVFSHEFGHDLGLPDYYDTQGGDNGTSFWTLMSSGSWNSHGQDAIGTTPNHMDAVAKLFLGWIAGKDLKTVDGTAAAAQQVVLGPSEHATDVGAQAVVVNLPPGSQTLNAMAPDAGSQHDLYSGPNDDMVVTATSPQVAVPAGTSTLSARVSYDLEKDFDYAYLQVSEDGTTWTNVATSKSTTTNPYGANLGQGITNCSGTGTGAGTGANVCTPHVGRPHRRPLGVRREDGHDALECHQRREHPRRGLLGGHHQAERHPRQRLRGWPRRVDAGRLLAHQRRQVRQGLRPLLRRREQAVHRLRQDAEDRAVQLRLRRQRPGQGGPLPLPGRSAHLVPQRALQRQQHHHAPRRWPGPPGRRQREVRLLDERRQPRAGHHEVRRQQAAGLRRDLRRGPDRRTQPQA